MQCPSFIALSVCVLLSQGLKELDAVSRRALLDRTFLTTRDNLLQTVIAA